MLIPPKSADKLPENPDHTEDLKSNMRPGQHVILDISEIGRENMLQQAPLSPRPALCPFCSFLSQSQTYYMGWDIAAANVGQTAHSGGRQMLSTARALCSSLLLVVSTFCRAFDTSIPHFPAEQKHMLQKHHRWLSGHGLPQGPAQSGHQLSPSAVLSSTRNLQQQRDM